MLPSGLRAKAAMLPPSYTGRLTETGQPVSVPYPFCERFLPVPEGSQPAK